MSSEDFGNKRTVRKKGYVENPDDDRGLDRGGGFDNDEGFPSYGDIPEADPPGMDNPGDRGYEIPGEADSESGP